MNRVIKKDDLGGGAWLMKVKSNRAYHGEKGSVNVGVGEGKGKEEGGKKKKMSDAACGGIEERVGKLSSICLPVGCS